MPQPGSLEFFLIERYLLYAWRKGQLFTGLVHHTPYPLRSVTVGTYSESLVGSVGIQREDWEHVCFSKGVDVEVFGLRPQAETVARRPLG